MNPQIITPENREHWLTMRGRDVTSTQTAALFGASPYLTRFELWHQKRGTYTAEFITGERLQWGTRLESAIAYGIAEDRGWTVQPMKDYWRLPELRIGASFDFMRTDGPDGPELVEVKNLDSLAYRDNWLKGDEDNEPEASLHIELQVQHQLLVTGFKRAHICALVGGNKSVVITRERDEQVIAAIRQRIHEFWTTVDAGHEPDPVMPADHDVLLALHSHAEPGKLVDLSDRTDVLALIQDYRQASADESEAKERKDNAKIALLIAAGDAEKVRCGQYSVSCGVVAENPGTVIDASMIGQAYGARKSYRGLRVTEKKEKAK